MSPSEHDLRAALHDGEDGGDSLDVDRIVAAGAATRHRRRVRVAAVAATVVVMGAGGAVAGVVLGTDRGNDTSAGSMRADARAGVNAPAAPAASSTLPVSEGAKPGAQRGNGSADAPPCPSSLPVRTLPGRPASDRLFDRTPVVITACSYGASLAPAPGSGLTSIVFTGSDADSLASSLENASRTPSEASCSAVRPRELRRLLFVGVDDAGRRLPAVGTTLTIPICDTQVSNGTTVRYAWVPPAGLRTRLYSLAPDGPVASTRRTPQSGIVGTPSR